MEVKQAVEGILRALKACLGILRDDVSRLTVMLLSPYACVSMDASFVYTRHYRLCMPDARARAANFSVSVEIRTDSCAPFVSAVRTRSRQFTIRVGVLRT